MNKITTLIMFIFIFTCGYSTVNAACDDKLSREIVNSAYDQMENKNAKVIRILRGITLQSVEEGNADDIYNLIKSLKTIIEQNDDILTMVTTDLNYRISGVCE